MSTAAVEVPQHLRALERANDIRLRRAAYKQKIKNGERSALGLILQTPWWAQTMTVYEVLRSQERWGRARTRKFLAPLAVHESRELGRLTKRQRDAIADAMAEKRKAARR